MSTPGADEAEVALLQEQGDFRALLMLAVTRHGRVVGLLEAYRRDEIGWSMSEIERSAVICEQLGASVAALVPSSDV